MHDREFRQFSKLLETFRDFLILFDTFWDFLRLFETFMNSMKYYGQDKYFMEKIEYYSTWCFIFREVFDAFLEVVE